MLGVVSREVLLSESGLSFLRGLIEGRHPVPPFSRTTGIFITEADQGRAVYRGTPSPAFMNPIGSVHGGWASTLLDSAMASASVVLEKGADKRIAVGAPVAEIAAPLWGA